ncbi:MAG: hypothetical protein HQL41_00915 [Alphaproteobacteria bacterium]|nr:hypothetical protein [Alphaproteobacteria bacterium]
MPQAVEDLIIADACATGLAYVIRALDQIDVPDSKMRRVCDLQERLTRELIDQRGGVSQATDKLRLLVARMRAADQHQCGAAEEELDYLLAESALLDLLSPIQ